VTDARAMTIYHVEFAKTGLGLSGGEVSMLGLIRYFQSQGNKNVVFTTDNGRTTYQRQLPESDLLQYITVDSFADEQRFGVFISYILRTISAAQRVQGIRTKSSDLIICHSDFFPNSISSWIIKRNNPAANSADFFHVKAPRVFYGYQGEFTGKRQIPRPVILHYRLNQWLYRKLSFPRTVILTVNPWYKSYLKRVYPRNRIKVLEHYGGGAPNRENEVVKKFDVMWVGRFQKLKGLDDLSLVVKELAKLKPDLKVVVLGGEPGVARETFISQLESAGVRENVELAGFVGGNAKYDYYFQSKVFLSTSCFESFGLTILEAMGCGIPVVAYDLPVFAVFGEGITKVPIGDIRSAAAAIFALLKNRVLCQEKSIAGKEIASVHSWETTGEEIIAEFS
jgi:glycosyltransferase involved in cell wall biosynthesis